MIIAMILSIFGAVSNADASFDSYLKTMASGSKCDPLACVMHTVVPQQQQAAAKLVKENILVDVSATESISENDKAFRFTAVGAKRYKK